VLSAARSHTDGFLWTDTYASSAEQNRPNWTKESLTYP
jgi:hypothetical protein